MGIKISELPQASQLTSDDIIPIVQSGETKKVSVTNVITNSHNTNQTNTYSSDYINNNFNKVDVKNTETQSTTDTYSCDYIDNKTVNEYSTSTKKAYSCNYVNGIDDTKTGFSYISGGVGGTEEIFVKDLKFRTIMVICANSGTTYGVDYSSIPGTVVTSFIVSAANTQSNANINYLVPLGSSTNMKIAQIKSNHSAGQTQVYIGVFYYPAD